MPRKITAGRTPAWPLVVLIALALGLGAAVAGGCSSDGGGGADVAGGSGAADGAGSGSGTSGDGSGGGGSAADASGSAGDTTADDDSEAGPLFECQTDEDCAAGICGCEGDCVEVGDAKACTEPKNCGSGTWCDPCTGHCAQRAALCHPCQPTGACTGDGPCLAPEDGACTDGVCVTYASGGSFCGLECLNSAGCPVGYDCLDVDGAQYKQCVASSGMCQDLGLCESDAECLEGEICNDTLNICAPGCTEDGQCAGDLVCTLARCVSPCTANADCIAPAECEEDGHCRIPGACETWAECPPVNYCAKDTGMCTPGCQIDEQCADASLACEDGACVPRGCEHNYQCSFEEECDKATGDCVPMTRDHCAVCDAGAQDPPVACGGDPNLCLSLQDKDGNAIGDFCFLTCAQEEIDKCPQAYNCEHIEAPDAGIDGYYCVRDCTYSPPGG